VASHDTASAVSILDADTLYISSGTWSLLGIQTTPILSYAAQRAGYTNEGARHGKVRLLKNIMGLWILQQIKHELHDVYSFAELEARAKAQTGEPPLIDINLPQFLSPPSMIGAIQDECVRTGQKPPQGPGELAACAYHSLANSYKTAIADLEKIVGGTYFSFPAVTIIGGGSRDTYLSMLTSRYTGKTVHTGASEATAQGNLLLQREIDNVPSSTN
jgi:rhamnulokinase